MLTCIDKGRKEERKGERVREESMKGQIIQQSGNMDLIAKNTVKIPFSYSHYKSQCFVFLRERGLKAQVPQTLYR